MIRHYPECPSASVRCEGEYCDCEYAHICVCVFLSKLEKRVIMTTTREWEKFSRDQFDAGFSEGIDAAQRAVEALPAPYKVRGQFDTYDPYHEGKSDMKDVALFAIDALRKE